MKFVQLNFLFVVLCVTGVFTFGIHSASSFFLGGGIFKVSAAQQPNDVISWRQPSQWNVRTSQK